MKSIRFSPKADVDYANLIIYVQNKWGYRAAKKVDDQIREAISLLLRFPEMYPAMDNESGFRKCVVTEQTSMIYSIEEGIVVIAAFFDTRQDPDRMEFLTD